MVIINTSAIEVNIHAVSPESIFGAAATAAAAPAAGAGTCAVADNVISDINDVVNIRRCKARYRNFINFLQVSDWRGVNRLLTHGPTHRRREPRIVPIGPCPWRGRA